MNDHRNCYTAEDMRTASKQAWSKGWDAKEGFDKKVQEIGLTAITAHWENYRAKNPGKPWAYDNPFGADHE